MYDAKFHFNFFLGISKHVLTLTIDRGCYIVNLFLSALRSPHYAVVLCILRYVKSPLLHGLHYFAHSPFELCAYSDADWAGDPTNRRSTTRYCLFLGRFLIYW